MDGLVPELYKSLVANNGCSFAIIGIHHDFRENMPLVVACPDGEAFLAHRGAVTASMFKKKVMIVLHLNEVWMADTSGNNNYLEPASKAANRENGLMFSLINPQGGVECGTIFKLVNGKPEKIASMDGSAMIDRKEMLNKGVVH